MYPVVLYVHLLVVTAAFFAMGMMLNSLVQMRGARTAGDALRAIAAVGRTEKVMPAATLLLLATGAFMTHDRWSWSTAWIDVSIAGLLLLTGIGAGALGKRGHALEHALRQAQAQPIDAQLARLVADPFLFVGSGLNIGLAAAVMFVMVLKPALVPGLLVLVIGGIAGAFTLGMFARTARAIPLDATSA